jgi:transcriptional regulator with XRE-family HTH domain
MAISVRQVKAARALLAWSQEDLAARSGVSVPTVKRIEAQDGTVGGRADTGKKIRDALECGGVEFTNGDQPGVRMSALKNQAPRQGPVDAPMVRAGRKMKAEQAKRRK